MASWMVDVEVDFVDAAERTATRSYRLVQQFDDVANDMDDVVDAAGDLITALNVLTWDQITSHRLIINYADVGAGANIAANNQVVAFTRVLDVSGEKFSFEVPAWDDDVYDQNSMNVLSAAYDLAAAAVANLIRNPENDELAADGGVQYSQSRTRKSRNIIHD